MDSTKLNHTAQATSGERAVAGYLDATMLIQCFLRRRLAAVELSERKHLRDIQVRGQAERGRGARSGAGSFCCAKRLMFHTWLAHKCFQAMEDL